jgi:acetyltransferase-like isoleucine patch superfamily enzyme
MSADAENRLQAPSLFLRVTDVIRELLPARLAVLSAAGLSCEPGVIIKTPSRFEVGSNVVLQRRALLHCGGKAWCGYGGGIILGDNVVVGPNCTLYGAGLITVGEYTHFGPGSMVMAQAGDADAANRQSTEPGRFNDPVVIGKGVWVGAGAVILGNTVLGDNCVIGPNSVVSGEYEAGTTLIGNPARAVRRRPLEDAEQ